MNSISAIPHSLAPQFPSPERIAGHAQLSEPEKIAELSRQFEAVLVRKILQESTKTIIRSDLQEDSATKDIYQDMISNQLADSISQSGGLGLGAALRVQLTQQIKSESESTPPASDPK